MDLYESLLKENGLILMTDVVKEKLSHAYTLDDECSMSSEITEIIDICNDTGDKIWYGPQKGNTFMYQRIFALLLPNFLNFLCTFWCTRRVLTPFSRPRKQAIKKAISLSEIALHKWARQGLNLRLPPRQGIFSYYFRQLLILLRK